MPVVALRKPATELPLSFVLTDREAMAPGTSLRSIRVACGYGKDFQDRQCVGKRSGLEVWSDPVSPLDGKEISLIITAASQDGRRQQ